MVHKEAFPTMRSGLLISLAALLLSTAAANAQSISPGGGFSILDYLEADTTERSPAEWVAVAETADTAQDAYNAYSRALAGYIRLEAEGEKAPYEVTRLRYATLDAVLRAAMENDGDQRQRFFDKASELARDMEQPLDSAWAFYHISGAYYEIGNQDRAITLLRRAALTTDLVADPDMASLLYKAVGDRGLVYGDIAFASFQMINMSNPSGRDQLAAAILEARAAHPDTPYVLRSLVLSLEDADNKREAIEAGLTDVLDAGLLDEGIELALSDRDASEQGDLLAVVNRWAVDAEQLSLAQLASELNPDDGEATRSWLRLASEYQKRAFLTQAQFARDNAMMRAQGANGDDTDLAQVAKAYIDIGDLARAREILAPLSDEFSSVVEIKARLLAEEIAQNNLENVAEAETLPTTDAQNQDIQSQLVIADVRNGALPAATDRLDTIESEVEADEARLGMVKELLNDDEPGSVNSIIAGIIDPMVAAEAQGLLAKWMVQNDRADEGRAIFEDIIQSLSSHSTEDADRIARKVAKIAADAEMDDIAETLAFGVSDTSLRQQAIANIGRVIGQRDPERALDYLDRLTEDEHRDQVYGNVSLGFSRQGDVIRAEEFVRLIVEDSVRVRFMRKIAEEQAMELDFYNILGPDAVMPEGHNYAVHDISPGPSFGTAKIYNVDMDPLREMIPPPPYERLWVTADDVRADISPVAPGRAAVSLMRSSYFNEKFISLIPGQTLLRHKQGRNSLEFIMIETGEFDLPTLYRSLRAQGHGDDVIMREGRIYTLRLPLLVMPDATFIISGSDVESLRLSDTFGGFLVVAGDIQIADTIVESWDEETNARAYRTYEQKKQFRPFLTVWTGGRIDMVGTTMFGLGYLGGKSYGLAMSAGPATITKNRPMWEDSPTGRIIDNSFRNMFYAYYAYEAVDVDINGNELVDNIVYGLDPHDRAQRLMMAFNTAYDTHEKHGLIISREVDNSWMIGNISFENAGSGYMLDRDSIQSLIYANIGFQNEQDGISFFESSCNYIAANWLFDNQRDGIKIRNSWNIAVLGNIIHGNGAAGIDVYSGWLDPEGAHRTRDFDLDPYFSFAAVEILDNQMGGNRAGIKFQGVNSALIGRNDMSDQSPRLFAGDLQSIGGSLMTTLANGETVGIAHQCAQAVPEVSCTFLDQGFLSGEGQGMLEILDDTGRCIPLEARPRMNTADLELDDAILDTIEDTEEGAAE